MKIVFAVVLLISYIQLIYSFGIQHTESSTDHKITLTFRGRK